MSFGLNNDFGFFTGGNADAHVYDYKLSEAIISYLNTIDCHSVLDLGCGGGQYTKAIREAGIECDGYDGNPDTERITDGMCKVLNLAQPFDLGRKYDCVLSLEVGEHIPKQYQDIFIDNVYRHAANTIIISWAVPGQTGLGHFNEMTNMDVITAFDRFNVKRCSTEENLLRSSAKMHYFKNTILVLGVL